MNEPYSIASGRHASDIVAGNEVRGSRGMSSPSCWFSMVSVSCSRWRGRGLELKRTLQDRVWRCHARVQIAKLKTYPAIAEFDVTKWCKLVSVRRWFLF